MEPGPGRSRLYAAAREIERQSPPAFSLPITAWVMIQGVLSRVAVSTDGDRIPGTKADFRIYQLVTAELNDRHRHPAFREVALRGHHLEVFPAWRTPMNVLMPTPPPTPPRAPHPSCHPADRGMSPCVLWPEHRTERSTQLTIWVPEPYRGLPGEPDLEALRFYAQP